MRTLVHITGSIVTARQRKDLSKVADGRIDYVVGVVEDYQVAAAPLQKTKWLGSKVYKVGESLVLTVVDQFLRTTDSKMRVLPLF